MDPRPIVLITGATAGIGLALAQRLAGTHRLVLCGRRAGSEYPDELPDGALYIQADFKDPLGAVEAIETALDEAGIEALHRVVINAGTGYYGSVESERPDTIRETLDVNLTAPIVLARHMAPFLEKVRGKLVLIGSVAHRGAANMPTYAASKAGLAGFARSLESEWQDRTAVQIIHPGPTATEMHEKAGYDAGKLRRLFFSAAGMADEIALLMDGSKKTATVSFGARLRRLVGKRSS
ncbi:MAG: SDR family NAD(P)-dependent oxidoreductase [Alphaproteobacteria bacterium]|nr:SDR family NAD(P)-dependent oxidoreductase [Alphaproteobacteria bacterium]